MHDLARLDPASSARDDLSAYEALAPHLQTYARRRAAYLDAVDRVVVASVATRTESLLDVGAGDGGRSARLAEAIGARHVVLAEPCRPLRARCQEHAGAAVWPCRAEDLPDGPPLFDVVTCLWNVLGHVPSRDLRIRALGRMKALMHPTGRLFLDVNNRYNARAYGWLQTLGRMVRDQLRPSDHNGDVVVTWAVPGARIRTSGHVFRPREVGEILAAADLRVVRRHVIDYGNGARRRWVCQGQLLFEVAAA